ncbi:antibiotic biosynthesis monooxygenase [Ensifer adhaerens]|uniref:putative quinol monooxygenase n=1 Tax=Ensifer adhaerens TaxID=106592 RepID=UPI001CBBD3CF|nr:antibiotic biosynthesis monooxygenase family protein [Ensifer adhaerens]MBZ7924156.1 antibiotic biosynthesis monooxygenase [Ensifer adhaerens]UAX96585.1 antibiotic biosynthesis monooxygenase [Ensifer adhaerens]UAY04071.1 antibiotic biosynthesis monooxygenase [Ensifer adhaerens]UAY12057.1 antibiotic biosynthesis monooxygenase [Ensifer adhaerens]
MTTAKQKILIAEVTARLETADKVEELLRDYGHVVRNEPGNEAFVCYRVDGQREKFVVYEIYADEVAFQAHLSAPENATLNAALAPLVEGNGSTLTFLQRVD